MKYLSFLIVALLLMGCANNSQNLEQANQQFSSELEELQDYFKIPGLAVSVIQDGETVYQDHKGVANVENNVALDSTHLFPIASLTKIFTGVAIMKLVEEGKLSLEEPAEKYDLYHQINNDSILIKHVLSHTSQGAIGEKFYYSSRFSLLTEAIRQASGMHFREYLEKEIFNPLRLKNTHLLKDSTQIIEEKLSIAKPYVLDDGIKEGFIDFGYSASAGIVSNLEDLKVFNDALDSNKLISEDSKKKMFISFKEDLPYGYGVFNQTIDGVNVVWGYGQYDCFSSLFLKVPEKNLTLLLLANNNLMSDPARLINGDVSSSLFALSFLKNYTFDLIDMKLLETGSLESHEASVFHRKKLQAQALSESFLSRFDSKRMDNSARLLDEMFAKYPIYLEYGDVNLLHTMIFLKDVAFYKELGAYNRFDSRIEKLAVMLLLKDEQNPYVNIYMGDYYARKGDKPRAKYYYRQITDAKNFSPNWYSHEATGGLKSL